MKVIGFAGQFYTLWEKRKETRTAQVSFNRTQNYTVWVAEYIKNISKNLDEAKRLYPDADVNLELRGTYREWGGEKPKYEPIPDDCYQFGKYAGKRIEDVDDFDYLRWYVNCSGISTSNMSFKNAKMCLDKQYAEHGYKELDGRWYTPEEYESALRNKEKHDKFLSACENGEPLEVIFENNFHNDGDGVSNSIYNSAISDFVFLLDEDNCVFRSYNGYNYYLPKMDGKGKLIKNKVMVITDYEHKVNCGIHEITIKKFSIKKN